MDDEQPEPTTSPFDYTAIDDDVAAVCREVAVRIRGSRGAGG
jgi:hypothetical protein